MPQQILSDLKTKIQKDTLQIVNDSGMFSDKFI